MAFELINLQSKSSPMDCFYVFDSNVWLPQLGLPYEKEYAPFLSFLGKVVKASELTGAKIRILITDLQLSEVFNKLLRYQGRIAWENQKKPEPDFNKFYKEHYRKSPDFATAFTNIKSDFEAIEHALEVVHPSKIQSYQQLVDFDPQKLDFNDHHILRTAQEYSAILVTNDKDYYGEDVRLATYNSTMIQQYKQDVAEAARIVKQARKN